MLRKSFLAAIVIVAMTGSFIFLFLQKPLPPNSQLRIVTTVWPVYVLTRSVAGESANVYNLSKGEVDPHNFSSSPQSVRELAQADFLIKNGGGLEESWLPDLIRAASNPKLVIIDLSLGFEVVNNNPHFWLDPILASQQSALIGDRLTVLTGDGSYQNRAAGFSAKLLALAGKIHDEIKDYERRDYVAQHLAFTYFANRFKLNEVATFAAIPGEEPTIKDLERISAVISAKGIRTIFVEPGPPEDLIENFARQLGLKLLVLDPMESGEFFEDYYEKVTLENLASFKVALESIKK